MKLLLFENLRPPQQESQHRKSRSSSFKGEEEDLGDEEPSSLLELTSFAGGSADEVVEATASVSRSNFRLSRVIVRVSCSSRTELATVSAYDKIGLW